MTPELDENMEAALLAGMVKSKMRKIDSLMESRPDIPADRIDLNTFVRQAQQAQPTAISPVESTQHHIPESHVFNANHLPTPAPVTQSVPIYDEELKNDIKKMSATLEKINNNLTKMSGMFGKVFHTLTKNK